MLRAMRVTNIEEIMPEKTPPPPLDPVTESSLIIKGDPVLAYVEQDHEAHIAVHTAIFSTLQKDEQELLAPQHFAHIAEHKSFDVKIHFEELIGAQITPENADQATQAAAQVAQIYEGERQTNEFDQVDAEEKRKNAAAMGSIKRKDLESSAKVKRADDEATADIERQAGKEIIKSIGEASAALGLDKK